MLRTRTPRRPGRSAGKPSRLGSLRTVLLVLAVVPSVALVTLWGISSDRLWTQWQTQSAQDDLAGRAGVPAGRLYTALQDERFATARELDGSSDAAGALRAARARTDVAVRGVQALSAVDSSGAAAGLREAVADTGEQLQQLGGMRIAADHKAVSQAAAFTYYTGLIGHDLDIFESLAQADNGTVTYAATNLDDLFWAGEMLSREDAVLARDQVTGADREQLLEWIGAQHFLVTTRVAPHLSADDTATFRRIVGSADWREKTTAETTLLNSAAPQDGRSPLVSGQARTRWLNDIDRIDPGLRRLMVKRTGDVADIADSTLHSLLERLLLIAFVGLVAATLVVTTTFRLTSTLRRRIFALRDEALTLQEKLPDVVERLRAGETVDAAGEVAEVAHGDDELGRLGEALNLARRSAVETAVQQAEQQRGFERLLQRIARRTQLLIGLQLKKLDQLERRHEDPQVLEGLFDLDHLTARLRRYEESLVILGGGQPQRRWRRPVPLLDVLRAAQGEVQDYRRIRIEIEDRPWISERAVGPMVHMLAELMENGAAFSRASMPVEVRAGVVDRGVTVEIEDRGLGMEPDQYREANEMMAEPPQMDVLSRAEDVRLGLYVVARLAVGLGVGVELRPSAFGGTRAIVYIPSDLVVDPPGPGSTTSGTETPEPAVEPSAASGPTASPAVGLAGGLPARARGRAMSKIAPAVVGPVAAGTAGRPGTTTAEPAGTPAGGAATGKLPKRVRQASLTAGLKTEQAVTEPAPDTPGSDREPVHRLPEPGRSGATVGAFQRQSRRARRGPAAEPPSTTGSSEPERTTDTTRDPE